ncbi:hypothetical protein L1987_46429 [Smallanthus sonchifolius]|uniref:Uncharacterized protein n=1 Tax=Smallanthus sonchifolius TaxID=185202 RepID=A0ACB9G0Q4_9ASTR|nr:hypothetical protein L1987_46429 [Smallanthus sonchifolius]
MLRGCTYNSLMPLTRDAFAFYACTHCLEARKKERNNRPHPAYFSFFPMCFRHTLFLALSSSSPVKPRYILPCYRILFRGVVYLSELRTRRLYMVKESRLKQKKLQNLLKTESKFHELEIYYRRGSRDTLTKGTMRRCCLLRELYTNAKMDVFSTIFVVENILSRNGFDVRYIAHGETNFGFYYGANAAQESGYNALAG